MGLKLDKQPPKKAELYIVAFRVTGIDIKTILSLSGSQAIYFEPRDDAGRQPHMDFRVVWIPKTDKSRVVASVQLAEHWTCLARSGSNFGIRTEVENAQELHEAPQAISAVSRIIKSDHVCGRADALRGDSCKFGQTFWPVAVEGEALSA